MSEQRLADILNVNAIQYGRLTKTKTLQAVVTYSKATGKLHFNRKMVALLTIAKWDAVLVGYDKENKILVLKTVPIEEYGSVSVGTPSNSKKKDNREVRVKSLLTSFGLDSTVPKKYRAQREGNMVLLQEIEK